MRIKLLLSTILFILFVSTNSFAETSIKAEVNKTTITTDEALTYKLTITSTDKKLPEPKIPELKDFSVISTVQSSSVSFAEKNTNTTIVYEFILAPTDIGKFKIEPSTIKIQGKTYSSDTFEIEVRQGKIKPQAPPEQEPSQTGSEEPQFTL